MKSQGRRKTQGGEPSAARKTSRGQRPGQGAGGTSGTVCTQDWRQPGPYGKEREMASSRASHSSSGGETPVAVNQDRRAGADAAGGRPGQVKVQAEVHWAAGIHEQTISGWLLSTWIISVLLYITPVIKLLSGIPTRAELTAVKPGPCKALYLRDPWVRERMRAGKQRGRGQILKDGRETQANASVTQLAFCPVVTFPGLGES